MVVNKFHCSCNDFALGAFNAVRAAKTLIADTSHNVNPASFLNPVKVLNVLAFPGRDVMPGGSDDGAAEFDSVQLFHNIIRLKLIIADSVIRKAEV